MVVFERPDRTRAVIVCASNPLRSYADTTAYEKAFDRLDLLVTIEENAVAGGAGSAVNEWLAANAKSVNVLNLGFPDAFVGQGTQAEMLSEWGLDTEGMLSSIQQRLAIIDASNCQ